MSNIQFTDELIFGTGSVTDGVSALNDVTAQSLSADSTAKLLYNAADKGTDTTVVTLSTIHNGDEFVFLMYAGYDSSTIAIIDSGRLSTQFTVASGTTLQTVSAGPGYDSVSANLARLHHLGYV
jgi:hypothetical protein